MSNFWIVINLSNLSEENQMSAHGTSQMIFQRSACQNFIDDGEYRKWYQHEKTWAVLCKSCERFFWRDFSKLEDDVHYVSNGWKDFPRYVMNDLQRKHFGNCCSAMS